jgi:hypothetical protein
MARRFLIIMLTLAPIASGAQSGIHEFYTDISASGLVPVTWASDSPALAHLGFDSKLGLEYDSPISLPLRLEAGYLGASASRISSSGELYRAWESLRFALLAGYNFAPIPFGAIGAIELSLLAGAAISASDYTSTALAYAYPSLVFEPRLALRLRSSQYRGIVQGPWLALPAELMFRSGARSLAPGLSLGWRYRLGALL